MFNFPMYDILLLLLILVSFVHETYSFITSSSSLQQPRHSITFESNSCLYNKRRKNGRGNDNSARGFGKDSRDGPQISVASPISSSSSDPISSNVQDECGGKNQNRIPGYEFAHSVDRQGKALVSDIRKRLTLFQPEHVSSDTNDQNVSTIINHLRSSDEDASAGLGSKLVSGSEEWNKLVQHKEESIDKMHLRDMLVDDERCDKMCVEYDGVYLDYSRQRTSLETMELLNSLAKRQKLQQKIEEMMSGEKINFTEDRAVLHTALRAEKSAIGSITVDGQDCVGDVHATLDQVKRFTDAIRNGDIRGYTGKRLRNFISVGIGGSYLGPEFLHECLKTEPDGINSALGYNLRFLANVDPVDIERSCSDLDPEETLIIVISKTFTTAETMLNARTMRQWLWDFMGNDKEVVRKHIIACSSISAAAKVEEFGINTNDYFFKFWDWVGGRYSVCSAVGAVPISLQYGFNLFEKFLGVRVFYKFFWIQEYLILWSLEIQGARSIDKHFLSAPFDQNIPVIMGLLGVWNHSFMNYNSRTTLPYAEALLKLPAHIQQLDMEVSINVLYQRYIQPLTHPLLY